MIHYSEPVIQWYPQLAPTRLPRFTGDSQSLRRYQYLTASQHWRNKRRVIAGELGLTRCIFRRLGVSGGAGAGPAFVHTIMSCPPSNMNRLILDISTRIAKSDPRLARPFLEYSFDQIELSSSKESVNLQ